MLHKLQKGVEMAQDDLLKICDPKLIIPNFELLPTCVCDAKKLWEIVLKNPVPLFKTVDCDPTLAIFNCKGFFLSEKAEKLYAKLYTISQRVPNIYVARFESESAYYIGKTRQKCGRWKPYHYYHLGTLAHEILGTKIVTKGKKEQDYSKWVQEWFEPFKNSHYGNYYTIRLKERVVISFSVLNLQASTQIIDKILTKHESNLISLAREKGLIVLNKT